VTVWGAAMGEACEQEAWWDGPAGRGGRWSTLVGFGLDEASGLDGLFGLV
jgi:hypothetical protein